MGSIYLISEVSDICVKLFKIKVTDPLCTKVATLDLKYNRFRVANRRADRKKRYFYYYAIATAFLKGPEQYSFNAALSIMIMNGSNLSRDINLASPNSTVTQHLITTHV